MSFFLPLLFAGALVSSAPSVKADEVVPRNRRALIDTAAHRQIAADLAARAQHDAESGQLDAARAQLLAANTMFRESGGLNCASAYSLVHIDFALQRYTEAADLLVEFADQSIKDGNVSKAAVAMADAADLYHMDNRRVQLGTAVARLRVLLTDARINESDRAELRKRLG